MTTYSDLIDSCGNIDEDIDQSHDDFDSKENHDANEADSKIKQMKEAADGGCFVANTHHKINKKNIFEEAYHKYNQARLQYFHIITLFKELDKKELCQKT